MIPIAEMVLGPLPGLGGDVCSDADADNPYADEAAYWLFAGVEKLGENDAAGAIGPLGIAAAFGSDEALSWLGAAYVEVALDMPASEGREAAIIGLGWIHTALLLGVEPAREQLSIALADLPGDVVGAWASRPSLFQTTVH